MNFHHKNTMALVSARMQPTETACLGMTVCSCSKPSGGSKSIQRADDVHLCTNCANLPSWNHWRDYALLINVLAYMEIL